MDSTSFYFQLLYRVSKSKQPIFIILLGAISTTLLGQVNVTLQSTSPLCGGFATGEITASPSGGTPPYNYQWSNGEETQTISNLPIGSYSVTVTDNAGITGLATTTLTSPLPLNASISVLSCGLPGILSANVNGGVPPYDYEWSNGDTTQTITNLTQGEYCLTALDQNSCGFVICQSVGPQLEIEVQITPATCGGATSGTATVNIAGGVSPFDILWNNGETTQTIEDLPPGLYSVTVTSINGCFASASGTIGTTPGSIEIELETTEPACLGLENGEITLNPNSGTGPFSYNWSTGDTTQTIGNLAPDTFYVTVTDNFGCIAIDSSILNYQYEIEVSAVGVNPTCAGANNGAISAFPSGGNVPYAYLWSTGDTSQMVSNAGAGTYSVTVTDDLGCTESDDALLTSPSAFMVNTSSTNASACGANDGSVSASPSGGGSPPFSYLWNNGATNNVLTNIPAGNYTVTVTSIQGCTATGTALVDQPQILEVELSGTATICANTSSGSLTVEVTYGTPPFNFEWSNGGSTQSIAGLTAGLYEVTVTSLEGCTGTASFDINSHPLVTLSLAGEHLTCFENNTGQAFVQSAEGVPPFEYLWSNGSTSNSINGLSAGSYSLTLTDDNGCSAFDEIEIEEPDDIHINFSSTGSCGANGSATAQVSGGTPVYDYLWSNGQNTPSIFGLAPGNFTVTVTDANGCTEIQTANVPAFPLVELEVSSTNTTCNGTSDGTVLAEINNGTAPYEYLWSNGSTLPSQSGLSPGNYSVTVTDDNECQAFGSAFIALGAGLNVEIEAPSYVCPGTTVSATAEANGGDPNYSYLWSDGQTNQIATGLSAGNLSVTVTDPSNCTGSATVFLLPGGMFEVSENIENIDCFGESNGSISLEIIGGSPPINYLWSNGANSPQIENLTAGNYTVTVSDQTECEQVFDFEITAPSSLLTLELDIENGSCGNLGSAAATVDGGSPSYDFLWSNGSTASSVSDLPAGTYSLTVTDINGCSATGSASVEVFTPPTCEINIVQIISAINGSDGELMVEVTNGSGPFVYSWNNGADTAIVSDLIPGDYFVTVTDANDCETICEVTLYNPAQIGDYAWLDEDMDGLQGIDENGFPELEITLMGTDDYGNTVNQTTNTDNDGFYKFNVQPGLYQVSSELPLDHIFSSLNQGVDASIDSDIDPTNNSTAEIILGPGETNNSIDIGLIDSPCDNVVDPGAICCDQSLCGPGNIPTPLTQLEAPVGGVGPLEFVWMYSTVPGPFDPLTWLPINNANGPSFEPAELDESTYFVRTVRRAGCGDFIATDQVHISVKEDAIAEIMGPAEICVDESVSYSAEDSGIEASYFWEFSGTVPPSINLQNVEDIKWNTSGSETIILTVNKEECTATDTLHISVTNSPIFCGDSLIIQAELIGSSTVEISWEFKTSDTSGLVFQTYWASDPLDFQNLGTPDESTQNGTNWSFSKIHTNPIIGSNFYQASLTDNAGDVIFSNIEEIRIAKPEGNLVEIFPSPFSDKINIEIIDRFDAKVTIDIYDALGRQVLYFPIENEGSYFEISTDHLLSGTYFVLVRYNGSPQKIFKLIK